MAPNASQAKKAAPQGSLFMFESVLYACEYAAMALASSSFTSKTV